jgi:hypothetical protein
MLIANTDLFLVNSKEFMSMASSDAVPSSFWGGVAREVIGMFGNGAGGVAGGGVIDARNLWIKCGFNVEGNPRCHLIFCGHLGHQFWKKCGGLSDENEDWIEFDHQSWKKEKGRTGTANNFPTQQGCQVKKM